MTGPDGHASGVAGGSGSDRLDGPDAGEEQADTDPMLNSANPYGAGWGAGWGASWADAPENADPGPPPTGRARPTVLGDVELPSTPEPFAFPTAPPRRSSPTGRTVALTLGGLAALAALVGLVFWLAGRGPSAPDDRETRGEAAATSATSTESAGGPSTATRDAGADAQLMGMLPPGYPPGSCRPVAPRPGSVSTVECGDNTDPGGPPAATYSIARDRAALDAAFAGAIPAAAVVTCPGNIQSPVHCPTRVSNAFWDLCR